MLNKPVRILDFDGSLIKQNRLLSVYSPEIVDLRDAGPRSRFWITRRDREALRRRIPVRDKNCVTFLGSGDFHHISDMLISRFKDPISVIDFDFHPDWDIVAPWQNCGSWVSDVLNRNKNILKFILIGVSSSDISYFPLYSANFGLLEGDRVEIYPYSHRPSVVYLRSVPENISFELKKGILSTRIYWNELRKKNLTEFFLHIVRRLPSKRVYITIDKDCLNKEGALTNWEEGRMSLDDLLVMLKLIKDNADIAGVDITGEYSDIATEGLLKSAVSRLDHPKNFSAKGLPEEAVRRVNEETNLKILELLLADSR